MPKSARQIFEEIQTLIKILIIISWKLKVISIIMKQKILCGIDGFEQGTAELLDYIQTIVQTERNNNGNFFRFC